MKIKVKFFASYKEALGKDEIDLDFDDHVTVSDLIENLRQNHPKLGNLLETLVVSVNLEYAEHTTELKDGDEVALLPPVSGG